MDNFFFDRPELQVLQKLRSVNSDLYFQLVKAHLSYYLDDIPPDCLTVNQFAKEATNRKLKRVRIGSSTKSPANGVIGAPLTQEGICRVHQLIEFIGRDENICRRDLFRRPGNIGRQENLKFLLNSGSALDLDMERISVYDCCEVLKKFLGELKDPLVPADVYKVFRLIPEMAWQAGTRNQRARILAKQQCAAGILVLLLPTESSLLLFNVLTLLTSILEHKEDNLTNPESLAVLFTPSVLLPRKLSPSEMSKEIPYATQVMCFMIENMPSLFEPPVTLIQDVKLQLKNLNDGSSSGDLVVPVRIAFCQPADNRSSEDYTEQQLQKLQTDVVSMPQCSQKKLFYRKLKAQNNELTPKQKEAGNPHISHLRSNITEPIRKYFTKSFKRKIPFQRSPGTDKLSISMSETKCASPRLVLSRKSSTDV